MSTKFNTNARSNVSVPTPRAPEASPAASSSSAGSLGMGRESASQAAAPTVFGRELSIHDKNPSNWMVTPCDGDSIEAINTNTGRHFKGTVPEFNKLLRG